MAGNPYQRPGFEDPRQSPQESAKAFSSYFQDKQAKSPSMGYGAGVGSGAAPAAPSAAPAAPAAAPSSQKAGGTGFVNFGTYFGANAPAIQAQAQKAAGGGGGALQAYGTAQGIPGGNANFRPGTSLSSLGKGQSSIDQGIARTQAQMGNLAPAMTGDMGKGTSLFDQMLGGATTQQAAESRFKALEQQLGQQQGEKRRVEAEAAQKAAAAAKESARKQWMENLPTQIRYNSTPEELQQMFEEEYASGAWTQTTPAMVSTPASEL
jgi:hypothetical protein